MATTHFPEAKTRLTADHFFQHSTPTNNRSRTDNSDCTGHIDPTGQTDNIGHTSHTGHTDHTDLDFNDLDQHLHNHFGWQQFRPLQREVVASVLAGKSSLAVMPTGGGKSLCFQLPALLLPGITVVISPLISLMKDQVDALVDRNIAAVAINSQDTVQEMERKIADIVSGRVRIVYVAPERLKSASFLMACRRAEVSLIAVDEAHCVSQWGHDFRPDYRFVKDFRHALGDPPLLALTATATRRVQEDLAEHLGISDGERYLASVDRPNLWLGLERGNSVAEKRGKVISLVKRAKGSTIVYVTSRRKADELAALLESALGETVEAYHAGLSPADRTSVQNRFMSGLIRVVTATNAFGMGIDKPDIRAVIHAGVPESIEAYYQEVGRAGRDGQPAECTMVVVPGMDVKMREFLLKRDEPTRSQVDAVIGRVIGVCGGGADEPSGPETEGTVPLNDHEGALGILVLSHLQSLGVLELVQRTNEGMRVRTKRPISEETRSHVWDRVQEHVRAKTERFGRMRRFVYLDPDDCRRKYLTHYFDESDVPDSNECCSGCQPRPVTAHPLPKQRQGRAGRSNNHALQKRGHTSSDAVRPVDSLLMDELKKWRWSKATERQVPAYVIFGDRDLEGIARARPRDLNALAACRGVGPTKLSMYGDEILSVIARVPALPDQPSDQVFSRNPGDKTSSQIDTLFSQGKTPNDVASSLQIDANVVWEHFLTWVRKTDDNLWKQQVRRLLSSQEYVAIRSKLRGRMQEPIQNLVQLETPFERRKIELTRAIMLRVGEI